MSHIFQCVVCISTLNLRLLKHRIIQLRIIYCISVWQNTIPDKFCNLSKHTVTLSYSALPTNTVLIIFKWDSSSFLLFIYCLYPHNIISYVASMTKHIFFVIFVLHIVYPWLRINLQVRKSRRLLYCGEAKPVIKKWAGFRCLDQATVFIIRNQVQ